jgi:maleate cis-trans isomerase
MINGKKIVVVLPAYNAALTLKRTYDEIPFDIVDDVVLVDDHSKDNTAEVGRELGIKHVIRHETNKGYGGNQKTCYDKALEIGADIVIYGCTTAGFLAGPEGDADMQQALVRAVGAPAVTTASSMVEAMRRAGVSRPAIVTPYLKPSNDGLISFLMAKGVEVSTLDSFFFTTTEQYDQVTSEQVLALAELTGRDPAADCLFIACTQLPTLPILEELRGRLNKPVLGAIQATVANAKRVLALGLTKSA